MLVGGLYAGGVLVGWGHIGTLIWWSSWVTGGDGGWVVGSVGARGGVPARVRSWVLGTSAGSARLRSGVGRVLRIGYAVVGWFGLRGGCVVGGGSWGWVLACWMRWRAGCGGGGGAGGGRVGGGVGWCGRGFGGKAPCFWGPFRRTPGNSRTKVSGPGVRSTQPTTQVIRDHNGG